MVGGKVLDVVALVVLLLGVCWYGSRVVGAVEEQEVKPNNYANFEFHESAPSMQNAAGAEVKETVGVAGSSFEFVDTTPGAALGDQGHEREAKPNNYTDFKFTEEDAHDQFAKGHYGGSTFDASDRFGERDRFSAQADEVVHDEGGEYRVGEARYRGSDARNRYPSSYELINGKDRDQVNHEAAGYKSVASNEVRLTNVQYAKDDHDVGASDDTARRGSSRFYTPASDPDFAFRFAKPEERQTFFGSNEFRPDNQADRTVYSQFKFDNSDATNDPTATYGTTTPVHGASSTVINHRYPSSTTSGHGCGNLYWAEHTKEWPSFFTVNTQATQAFGPKAGDIYGTTTLLQALYDTRDDGYSQLLSHGTAALMNAYAMPHYGMRHDAVVDLLVGALPSRIAAGVQGQKFRNANHAYGPDECLN